MREITLLAPAKVNFSIDVTGRLENGFHTVEMILQSIDLCDIVTAEKTQKGVSVSCAQHYVPNDQRNIAWKAADAFFKACPEQGGAHITIKKNIPVSSGLAGGSTDAAGVLKALNRLYGEHLSREKLLGLARGLGSDVAFCLEGGTQLARGTGDELTALPDLPGVNLVLVKPDYPVSTPWVYKNLDLDRLGERPDTSGLINAVAEFDIHALAAGMRNVLESVTVKKHPELKEIMDRFMSYGALGSRMSGSGPTVFGIFDGNAKACCALRQFSEDYRYVYQVKTIGRGEK